jgi:hypothetical protein|nr:MAG TPA: hypothetical protein [Caudoviricetes sp.]
MNNEKTEKGASILQKTEDDILLFLVYVLINLVYVIGLFGFLLPFLISSESTALVLTGAALIISFPVTVFLSYKIFKIISKEDV